MAELLIDKNTEGLVRQYIPGNDTLRSIADYFSILSDCTRIKLISALSISTMCVGDLSSVLGLNQTTVSHQLRILRGIGAVDYKRQGKVSFYYLKDKGIMDIMLGAVNALSS